MIERMFSGVRLTFDDGRLSDEQCSGLADPAAGLPWSRGTPSQIASISKQFAAVIALLLIDEGALALEQPVRALLPEAPPAWDRLTVRHLMTHTAGIRHWDGSPGFDSAHPLAPGDRLERILAAPLLTEPGAAWRYSSPGYIVLAAALGRAAGGDYASLVRHRVVGPLGLAATTVQVADPRGCAVGCRDRVPLPREDLSEMAGTGDICSSAEDVGVFLAALHTGSLLPARARSVFRTISVPLGAPSAAHGPITTSAYGSGHFTGAVHGEPAVIHPGDDPGYQSLAVWVPSRRRLVVALSNDETDDIEGTVAGAFARGTADG